MLLRLTPESEVALIEWAESAQRVRDLQITTARRAVIDGVIAEIIAEIRRRIGASFTLNELVTLYQDSSAWCLEVAMRTTELPWAYDLSLVQGAAFDRYARGAVDYHP
jgi:hypothetical protein